LRIPKLPRKIRVPLIYGLFSILWIFLSDRIVMSVAANIESVTLIAILKGTVFVLVSTLLIYVLLEADDRHQASLESQLSLIQDSFSTLFEKNPQPMWLNDPNSLEFITVNQAALQLFGYTRSEFLALTATQLCFPDEIPLLIKTTENHKEGLRRTGPWQMVTHDGKNIYAYIVMVDIDFSGRIENLATVMDISEQKIIEETLKKTTSERDDFEAFGYSVSHDLRASLRAVSGYNQILQEDYASFLDAQGRGYLDKMNQASQTMNKTIDNLLMLSGITHRNLQLKKVDLAAVAREVAEDLTKQDPQRKVEFILIPEVFAWADLDLLRIVLFQLLDNAWKYSSKKAKTQIEFGCTVSPDHGRIFFVKDNGAGFDPAIVEEMFKPFQRFHPAAEFDGSGVGLNIAARIIERHHGRIWAEGQPDVGATFYFTLGMDDLAQK